MHKDHKQYREASYLLLLKRKDKKCTQNQYNLVGVHHRYSMLTYTDILMQKPEHIVWHM